ncbi:unnamed protein product [Mytilus coruscus]|uniref:DNA-directed DNA polymerase n=1 Tax=Mytilus coruscus TaxID=42192 RepID=A0A6J8F2D8_MYTCO|nr:unnamed protein product [Mytilus coruscus]
MVRDIDDGYQEKAHPHFRSKSYISLQNESNDHNLNEAFQAINRVMDNKGSNWILNKVICLEVHTLPYSPIAGSMTYPKEGEAILEYQDFHKQMRVPFVIYADFECYAKKIETCQPDPNQSSTTHQTKFVSCGYSYVVVSSNDKYSKSAVVYRGENAVEHFFDNIFTEEEYIDDILRKIYEELIMSKIIKVRDHDHLGMNEDNKSPNYSNYRGAACQRCNLMLKYPNFIVYFHNLRNFDAHLLLSEAGKFKDKTLSCIPNNMEKYVSFSVEQPMFLDTYQCISSSLETLIANLAADGFKNFKQFRKAFPNDEHAKRLLQKSEYC